MTGRDRLVYTLASAGVPVDRVTGEGPAVVVSYQAWATQAQQTAGAAIVAAFDWSDAAQQAWEASRAKDNAAGLFVSGDLAALVVRAVVGLTIAELNDIRQWVAAFKVQTAAATSLANLQARVATLPAMPDRSVPQARDAIAARIAAGGD